MQNYKNSLRTPAKQSTCFFIKKCFVHDDEDNAFIDLSLMDIFENVWCYLLIKLFRFIFCYNANKQTKKKPADSSGKSCKPSYKNLQDIYIYIHTDIRNIVLYEKSTENLQII